VGGSGGRITCYINGYWGHTGVDIGIVNGYGTPVLASASGTVVKATNSGWGYGRHIMVDHGNGYVTLYAHNTDLYVSVGDKVGQGQIIAGMGATGNAYGVHLHFEVRQNGRIMNPVNYIGG
jgi:murein DD-endopeptidase MepM/ murein hydrolase activator NlpD